MILGLWATGTCHAQSHVSINNVDGRVTMLVHDAPLRTILEEWNRTDGVPIVNVDRIEDASLISLQLTDVTEISALSTLLRGVGGYVAVRRADGVGLDRVVILPRVAQASVNERTATPVSNDGNRALDAVQDARSTNVATRPGGPLSGFAAEEPQAIEAPGADAVAAKKATTGDEAPAFIDGANPATLAPRALRPPTPLLPPPTSARGSSLPGAITTGNVPPGVVYPVVTNPRAVMGDTSKPN